MLKNELQSARLSLTPFAEADVVEVTSLLRQPGVRRYLLDDEIVAAETVAGFQRDSTADFAAGMPGIWAVRQLESPTLIGISGFRVFWDDMGPELVYAFDEGQWGRGYAQEAVSQTIDWAVTRAGFRRILASTDVPNVASVRVLRRLGFEITGEHPPRADQIYRQLYLAKELPR